MTGHSNAACSAISALSINAPMCNLRVVRQCIGGQSGDYALAHYGQSGDDRGNFLRVIRPSTWPRPNSYMTSHQLPIISLGFVTSNAMHRNVLHVIFILL